MHSRPPQRMLEPRNVAPAIRNVRSEESHFYDPERRFRSARYNEALQQAGNNGVPGARWLVVIISVILVGVLIYLLTLSTHPAIADISPEPNSATEPGDVTISASISARSAIQSLTMWIDEEQVRPQIRTVSDREWDITYNSVLPEGTHDIELVVVDDSNRTTEHSWSIDSAGPLHPPSILVAGPVANTTVEDGLVTIVFDLWMTGDLAESQVLVDGQQLPSSAVRVSLAEPADDSDTRREWNGVATAALPAGDHEVEVSILDEYGGQAVRTWKFMTTGNPDNPNSVYREKYRQYVSEPFLKYWHENGHENLIGEPVGPRYRNEDGAYIQYFEYARLESENLEDIGRGRLGSETYGSIDPAIANPEDNESRFFEETGHSISDPFRTFWEENGGLAAFGYPITEELDRNGTRVQYFERTAMEYSTGSTGDDASVRLQPLGKDMWNNIMESMSP